MSKQSTDDVKQLDAGLHFGAWIGALKRHILLLGSLLVLAQLPAIQVFSQSKSQTNEIRKIEISKKDYADFLAANIDRVEEFRFIKRVALSLGVKVYLFGGTAASFGHYAKWDLLRIRGDQRYHPARFDYKYINIYRSTQDLDIVVDGPLDKIKSLEKEIVSHFPYMQGSKGSKQAWEIRSLRENIGDKLALLNNPDFLNQHTDSQSVGMIEITDPPSNLERIRDLRDWDNGTNSGFFNDLMDGKIHFYFSHLHETTRFFIEGRNPPILAVIRFFIKVFQLDLETRSEDLERLNNLISSFNPMELGRHSYLPKWFSENIPKLIQNAMDVEKAMKVLNKSGLRAKLMEIGDVGIKDTVAWWMNKQPLESKPLGEGNEKTAKDLGIEVISHETTSFLVYESITRSHMLLPNILSSREGHVGEAAVHGDGFYAMIGERSGFLGTGFTIRFRLKPEARLKTDFEVFQRVILIKNRSALEVIPENLTMGLNEYYNWLLSEPQLSKDDLGIHQRLRLALRANFLSPSEDELRELSAMDLKDLRKIFSLDPSGESRLLLLKIMKDQISSRKSIFDIYVSIWNWKEKANLEDVKFFDEQMHKSFGPVFIQKFFSQNPPEEALIEALVIGMFEDQEEIFWDAIVKKLSTIESFDEVWNSHWLPYVKRHKKMLTRGEYYNKRLRPYILKALKKFAALHPTKDQLSHLNTVSPQIKIGILSRDLYDPVIFLQTLSEFSSSDLGKKAMSVWHKNKQKVFELSPTLAELTEIFPLVLPTEIKTDLLRYALDQLVIRRPLEWNILMGSVKRINLNWPFPNPSSKETEQFEGVFYQLVDRYLATNPPSTDVLGLFQEAFTSTEERRINLIKRVFRHAGSLERINAIFSKNDTLLDPLLNRVIVEEIGLLKGLQVSHSGLMAFIARMGWYQSGYLVFKEYLNSHFHDYSLVIDVLKTKVKATAAKDREFIDPLWMGAFGELLKTGPDFEELLSLKLTVTSPFTYRALLTELLKESKTLKDLENVIFHYGENWLERLSPELIEAILAVNDELIPAKFREIYPSSPGRWNFETYHRMTQYFTTSGALLKIFDQLVLKGVADGPNLTLSGETKSRFSDLENHQYRMVLGLFTIFERHQLTHRKNNWPKSTSYHIIKNLTSTYPFEMLGLMNEQELILNLNKFFVLNELKNTVEGGDYRNGSDPVEGVVRQIVVGTHTIPGTELASKLSEQLNTIKDKYGYYPRVFWAEKNGNRVSPNVKSRVEYEEEITREIMEADEAIAAALKRLPKWKEMLEDKLGHKVKKEETAPVGKSCQAAIGH